MSAGTRAENELTVEEYETLLKDLHSLGVFQLVIAGGEPFCRPDVWEILEMAESLDFCLFIETNTMLLDREDVKRLAGFSISDMNIPLEGMERTNDFIRGPGHFAHAVGIVKELLHRDVPVQVRTTVSKMSLPELEPLARMLVDLGVPTLLVSEFTPIGRGLGYARELLLDLEMKKKLHGLLGELRAKYSPTLRVDGDANVWFEGHEARMGFNAAFCGAIEGESCIVLPDGTITPCDQYPFYGGNIRNQNIRSIIDDSPVFKWFREFDRSSVKGVCGRCEYNSRCGGCRIFAFLFNGDLYSEDPMCWRVLEARGVSSPLFVGENGGNR